MIKQLSTFIQNISCQNFNMDSETVIESNIIYY